MILFIGCHKRQIHINEVTIQELSKYHLDQPSATIALFLFVRSSSDELCRLNINTLYRIYKMSYIKSGKGFREFISSCLNQREPIESESLKKAGGIEFRINKNIDDDLTVLGINHFIDKYCNKINSGRFEVKREYKNSEQINSILYFLFVNNYRVLSDDYAGKYIVIK